MNTELTIAKKLLQIKAIKLNPANPFTWASGWRSPIYCDNRKVLAYPMIREDICRAFVQVIEEKFPSVQVIAGVATGAIAHGMLVANYLGLPFVYVRAKPKEHGLGNMIEGELQADKKVVMIEDLVSTGGSSLAALAALREAKANVLGMCAIFSYGFEVARENFLKENCTLYTLSNYTSLLQEALTSGYINEQEHAVLKTWHKNPAEFARD
ncbi:MAG: orotate phosphoribosyltransferase [Bacteroidales bacterium]